MRCATAARPSSMVPASASIPRLASIICASRSVCCCTWLTISSVLPVIDEPKALLAASTERSISAEVDLTLAETSFDAATSELCAFCALDWILSVVLAVTVESERSMSAPTEERERSTSAASALT